MTVNNELISHLAKLAKLDPSAAERLTLAKDLDKILAMVAKLQQLDVSGVEPLRYLSAVENDLRPDQIQDELARSIALQNAPDTDAQDRYFRVPKVIEKGENA